MKYVAVVEHYDLLVQEDNDPVYDPPVLQEYMDKWDGKAFIDALALTRSSDVLEIGVGTGRLAKNVLKTGCKHFTGIDISPATINRARENLRAWDNISLIHGDFISYPFTQTYDVAYCSLTLFHFKDKRSFIRKISGLIPKGRIVLSIPKEKENVIDYGTRVVEIYPDDVNELKTLLADAGFAMRDTIEVEFAQILVAQRA